LVTSLRAGVDADHAGGLKATVELAHRLVSPVGEVGQAAMGKHELPALQLDDRVDAKPAHRDLVRLVRCVRANPKPDQAGSRRRPPLLCRRRDARLDADDGVIEKLG